MRALPTLAILALAVPAFAAEKTNSGLDPDALTPPGMARLSVAAPAAATLPVRLVYGSERRPEVLVDVLVAPSAAEAAAAMTRFLRGVASPPPASGAVGDAAVAGDALVAFTRANVFVAVRRISGAADPLAIALAAEAAIDAAPTGSPRAAAPALRVPALATGASAAITTPAGVLAADLRATGPATITRTPTGWRVTRTGGGAITLRLVGVDARLRPF